MNRGKSQQELPVTSSSEINESKGPDAYMWLIVLLCFVVINKFFDFLQVENGTPIAAVTCGVLWFGFKMYLKDKPPRFLVHLFEYLFRTKKRYTHFCQDNEDVVS